MVKRLIACLLTLTLVFTSVNLYKVQASKKMKLNKTKVLVRIGSPVKLKVKNAKKKKIKWNHSRAIPSFPSQLEWKIGLAWANTRGSLNSPS